MDGYGGWKSTCSCKRLLFNFLSSLFPSTTVQQKVYKKGDFEQGNDQIQNPKSVRDRFWFAGMELI